MKRIVSTKNAPIPVAPYNQGIIAQKAGLVFTAGQLGLDPTTNKLVEGGLEKQAQQALKNIEQILVAAGSSLDNAVKVTIYLDNMDDFAAVNGIYEQYFTRDFPARTAIEVARLPLDALIEIEAIAVVSD